MKKIYNKRQAKVSLLAFAFIFAGNASASASFNSQAEISFSIASMPADVSAIGSYTKSLTDSYVFLEGDSVVSDINNDANFSLDSIHTFAVSGNAGLISGGSVTTSHLGKYLFQVINSSETTSYDIDMSFGYNLSIITNGEYADSDIVADFSDHIDGGWLEGVYLHAATYDSLTSVESDTIFVPLFNLAPGEVKTFYADITIGGNLDASPVPLPATVWMFLSGLLGVFGVKKRRMTMA